MNDVVRVQGLAEVHRRIMDIDDKVARSILRKGLRKGAKKVLAAARGDAPRRTGVLAANLKIRGGKTAKGKAMLRVAGKGADMPNGKAFYLDFVTGGHFAGPRQLGTKRKWVPGNDFVTRAYYQSGEAAVAATVASWLDLIDKETAK